MESAVAFLLILATISFATDHVCSQRIYASENPVPVGNNVTLYSQTSVTNGIWKFNNNSNDHLIVMIFSGSFIISDSWAQKVTFNSTSSSLTLKGLRLEDSGLYTLLALNSFQAQLTLSVQVPITNVTLRARATNLVEFNDTAVFMCSVSTGTPLNYVWMKNNNVLSQGGQVQLSDGNATLAIVNVTRNDVGPFTCKVFNGVSNGTSPPINLNISYGPSNTTMAVLPTAVNYIYRRGSDIVMSCLALSSPPAMIKWMFNGMDLNKYSPQIQLNNVNESNSGIYKCVFSNAVTNRFSSASTMIYVLDPLENVEITRSGGPAILNEPFTLRCQANGTVDRIQWWRNGHIIVPDNTTIFGTANKTLTLNSVQLSDNGDYRCQAFNSVSNMTSGPYRLEVNYGPEMPTITGPTVVKSGHNITFRCYASSNPPSTYGWYFNGNLVASSSVYVTPPLSQNMSGMYTCRAYNNITGLNKTAQHMLTVLDPIKDVRVEMPMYPPKEGYQYVLTCNVTGPVDHVYWFLNGTQLHEGDAVQINNNTITLNPLRRNDTGYYKCMAVNAVENMTSPPHKLLVNFGPDTPVINGPAFVEMGQRAVFNCSAMSVPPSQFSWWFNGTQVANTSVFITDPMTFNMSGEYKCMAYNDVTGKNSTNSIMVTVIEAIESVMIINNTAAINSENFTLTCQVIGPYDTIYWTKDNVRLNGNTSDADAHMYYHMENNTLHFTPVTITNDGTYQCFATNKAGQHGSPHYMLLVNYGPLSVNITGPYSAKPGVSVSLRCSADSQPTCDFYWFFNNKSSAVLVTGSVLNFSATMESAGDYICMARNPVTNIIMYTTKEFTVTGHASGTHRTAQGGLMLMSLFGLFVPVLFN